MEHIQALRLAQHRLLRAWLRAGSGEKRFAILSELRIVERQLSEEVKRTRAPSNFIRTYAVQDK